MARRPHPIFGYVARVRSTVKVRGSGRSPHEPRLKPEEQEGVLWQGASVSAIEVRHTGGNRYTAVVTPRCGNTPFVFAEPMSAPELMRKLLDAGCRPIDIGDAFYKANPYWLSEA